MKRRDHTHVYLLCFPSGNKALLWFKNLLGGGYDLHWWRTPTARDRAQYRKARELVVEDLNRDGFIVRLLLDGTDEDNFPKANHGSGQKQNKKGKL